jgi:hypothetical protein
VVPIHWGTFLSNKLVRSRPEVMTEPPRRFAEQLAKRAPEVELRALEPGEALDL